MLFGDGYQYDEWLYGMLVILQDVIKKDQGCVPNAPLKFEYDGYGIGT